MIPQQPSNIVEFELHYVPYQNQIFLVGYKYMVIIVVVAKSQKITHQYHRDKYQLMKVLNMHTVSPLIFELNQPKIYSP